MYIYICIYIKVQTWHSFVEMTEGGSDEWRGGGGAEMTEDC